MFIDTDNKTVEEMQQSQSTRLY